MHASTPAPIKGFLTRSLTMVLRKKFRDGPAVRFDSKADRPRDAFGTHLAYSFT